MTGQSGGHFQSMVETVTRFPNVHLLHDSETFFAPGRAIYSLVQECKKSIKIVS